MKVLVADDSAFMRRAITQMLSTDPQIQVVGTARNGKEAVELVAKLKPDVVTMDIEMPEMDGLTALRVIMRDCPTQVLMLSSLTTQGSVVSLQALKLGAADVLAKDSSQISLSVTNIQQDLLTRVRGLAGSRRRFRALVASNIPVDSAFRPKPGQFDMICIGSSTGGPPVLETIISALPANLNPPIVIAQHMPELFTQSMAQRLAGMTPLKVHHGVSGMTLERRSIYIAPGGKHTHLVKTGLTKWELKINGEPAEALYKPSVDALFASAASALGNRVLCVVLTGIGDDGLIGARQVHAKGGVILAQDEESCVVYGMPKSVTQNGLVAASLNPVQLGKVLASMAESMPIGKAG